jgi:poly-gamma-glutamate capsule biosynthesis protein CapA/YwtB (metallophosphatase superfamily)
LLQRETVLSQGGLPSQNTKSFLEVANLIQKGEVRFTNLEVTAHHYEGFPSAFSGGTWAIAEPTVLSDIQSYGFNLLAWANNHTLDYSYGGLEATEKYLNQYGFVHSGVGKNLAEASAPKYLDCPSGRVALIAVTSTFHESWIAGEQRRDMIGRPGVNPLRIETTHVVSKERMKQLKEISSVTDINAEHNLSVKEGFAVDSNEDSFTFGKYNFVEGKEEGKVTRPFQKDLQRVLDSILEAKRQADYVLVSVHAHEMKGGDKSQPAEFLKTFSRTCIDHGAHAVIGHGPHILRGIEIYKNRPIFYSLGNFIFQNDTIEKLPSDFYEKYGLGHTHNVADALDTRSENNTKGLGIDPNVWESVIPWWRMIHGELVELRLYPINLGYKLPRYKRGWPVLSKKTSTLEKLNELSKPFGTNIIIENDVGIVKCI